MKIGILDIQGSVEEHFEDLGKCGVEVVLVKKVEDLSGLCGLIIPGGESGTVGKLLREFELRELIIEEEKKGMCVWGTCAGAILLAKEVVGDEGADVLGLMDISVKRNAYGRQLDSFEGEVEFFGKKIHGVFIRAPKIMRVGENVEVLSKYDRDSVVVREKNLLITTFHPELTDDLTIHKYFVEMCK